MAYITLNWPDIGDWGRGRELSAAASLFGAALILAAGLGAVWERGAARLRRSTPWLLALGLFFSLWQATDGQIRAVAAAVLSAAARHSRSIRR